MAQKPVLGKGLASLFPGANMGAPLSTTNAQSATLSTGSGALLAGVPYTPVTLDTGNRDRHPGISLADVDEIRINTYQPRRDFDAVALEELAQSIRSNGIIQPLIVRKTALGSYELIAGERRLRAAKMAGLKQVPIVIRRSTDKESLELALIENIQRQDLNCIDEALAYLQLIQDFSLTQEDLASRVGKDRVTIANHLRLLRLPEAIIDDLKRQILTFGHGKVLLGLEDQDARLRVRAIVVEKKLSVRETEILVNKFKSDRVLDENKAQGNVVATDDSGKSKMKLRLESLAQDLTRHWSAKVEINGAERRGKIVFHYSSRQELDRLIEAMQNQIKVV